MSRRTRSILERVARGETDSEAAVRQLTATGRATGPRSDRILSLSVRPLAQSRPRVRIRLPMRLVEAGIALGSHYAPGLAELDLGRLAEELHELDGGTLLEVEDLEGGEHVLLSIE